jgi:fermentation-respiration switch protein FrsA (DUF1100 family)
MTASETVSPAAKAPGSLRTKLLAGLLLILLLLLGGRFAFQIFLQDRLAYVSRRYISTPAIMALPGSAFTTYTTQDGRRQWGYRIDAPASAPKVPEELPAFYLFLYGRGGVVINNAPICSQLALTTGASFFIVEYRAHGFNEGQPGAAGFVADAVGAYDTLKAQGALDRGVGVIGHSMGVGVGLALAEVRPIDRMILVSGSTSLLEGARRREPWPVVLLLREDWPNERRLLAMEQGPSTNRPRAIAVLHGARDEVVPVEMAHRLATAAGSMGSLRVYPQAAHNDIFNFALSDIAHFMRGGTLL